MPSSVPKGKKFGLFLSEKIYLLDKLYSVLSYRAVGCVFSVKKPTTYIKQVIFKTEVHAQQGMYLSVQFSSVHFSCSVMSDSNQLMEMLCQESHRNLTLCLP